MGKARNEYQQTVVEALRKEGYEVYDFRNPPAGGHGFKWSEIDPEFQNWTPQQCKNSLAHPLAIKQLNNDLEAMKSCDVCVLVLPCGRSAHMEAGWFAGRGKKVIALLPDPQEPELMYGIFDGIACNLDEVLKELKGGF